MDRKDDNSTKPKEDLDQVTGCSLTWEDEPAVVASFACFAAYIVYGASASSLGAALPSLAEHFNRSKAGFGLAFTIRGIGYFVGTLASAWILNLKQIPTKEMMTCFALLFTGITQGIISGTDNFSLAMVCFFIQGFGFGGIDTMANCVLPEVWGRRVQPWMQALHSFFGIGAILGPAFVGAISYQTAFVIIMVASFAPLIGLVAYRLIKTPPCISVNQHTPLVDESASAAESIKDSSEVDSIKIAPYFLRFVVSLFFFLYVGVETGFAGWIPTYVLLEDVTDSNSKAAYLSSIFWAFLTAGRVLAIFTALMISATTMIRLQLGMIMVICFLALFLLDVNYTITAAMCGLLGFSLSSVFPVMMTLFGDYGFAM
ncbi:MFS transporter [archaeon]|nr:MAG: MFS transporter [archaeon]